MDVMVTDMRELYYTTLRTEEYNTCENAPWKQHFIINDMMEFNKLLYHLNMKAKSYSNEDNGCIYGVVIRDVKTNEISIDIRVISEEY